MPLTAKVLERVAERVEHTAAMDPVLDRVQSLVRRLPPGPLKDGLSGSFMGHPLHPLLVAIPLGAFTGASFLDLTGVDRRGARALLGLGLASSLPTAAAGLSDWADTDGAERRIGGLHAASNIAGLTFLFLSWTKRGRSSRTRAGALRALGGLSCLTVGGWLGGHLSYAMGVGVDTTVFQQAEEDWTRVCWFKDLVDGEPRAARLGDTPVIIVLRDGEVHALADRCTHRGAPLHEGTVADGCIECPWHGSRFDLTDGSVVRGPATRPQPAFETRVEDGAVMLRRQEVRSLRLDPVR